MILLYHKIDLEVKTEWWVSVDRFYRHLVQLKNKEVVYLDDYDPDNPNHVVITFDGVYKNILTYAAPLLQEMGYPFELFITGDVIGKNNEFDAVEPDAPFATLAELKELVAMGGRMQWHTKTHRKIENVPDEEVGAEIATPDKLKKFDKKGFKWFAYSHGLYDERSKKIVSEKYHGGLACENGSWSDKTIWPRNIITETSELTDTKISVIIPCYNYAHYLTEAVESVIRQTYLPDEIILSDDASTDHSYTIMESYRKKYPELIKIRRNKKNLGIEKHFNTALEESSGEIIGLLGADNRYTSNYVEECFKCLTGDSKVAIAYTDFALFGNRSEYMYSQFYEGYRGSEPSEGIYIINFPRFNKKTKNTLLNTRNFIHGSSMYKRKAFQEAGGYKSRSGTSDHSSEDYTLFQAMIRKGWIAEKAENTILEYRQHSVDQANQQFSYFSELNFLRDEYKQLNKEIKAHRETIDSLNNRNRIIENEINQMKRSRFWKLRNTYRKARKAIRHPRSAIKYSGRVLLRGLRKGLRKLYGIFGIRT